MTPANLHVRKSCKQCNGDTAVLTRQNDVYNYACVCLCLNELLLGVSPRLDSLSAYIVISCCVMSVCMYVCRCVFVPD